MSKPENFDLNLWLDHLKSQPTQTSETPAQAPTARSDVVTSEAIPIGLIANLSLTKAKSSAEHGEESDGEKAAVSAF